MAYINLRCTLLLHFWLDGFSFVLELFEALDLLLLVFNIDFSVSGFIALFLDLFAEKLELFDLFQLILPALVAINDFLNIYHWSSPIRRDGVYPRVFLGLLLGVERNVYAWLQIVI